jgi:hypothetical protein
MSMIMVALGSIVGTMIGVQAAGPRRWVQVPAETRDFSLLKSCPDQLWGTPNLVFKCYMGLFSCSKA